VRIGGKWKYRFGAFDKQGQLIDFILSSRRNTYAAHRFLHNAVKLVSDCAPFTITTEKLTSYPKAIRRLQEERLPRRHGS